MAHAAVSTSFRTISLSVSTMLWAALLIGAISIAPRIVPAPPLQPSDPITVVRQAFVPPETPHAKAATPRTVGEMISEPMAIAPAATVDFTPEAAGPAPVAYAEPAPIITHPAWVHRPSGRELEQYFPARAIARGKSGYVSLACTVRASGFLACSVAEETPAGWGFGDAALRISQTYQMEPATRGGVPIEAFYTLRIPFELH